MEKDFEKINSIRRAVRILLAGIFLMLFGIVILVLFADPFFHYHKPLLEAFYYNEQYQDPGMAKNFEYDTVLLGSSMTENFRVSWFEECDEKAVKLSYSGARSRDIEELLKICLNSGNEIKHIYLDLNDYQLSEEPLSRFGEAPEYLYDNNIFTDVNYLFNKDVITVSLIELLFSNRTDSLEEDDGLHNVDSARNNYGLHNVDSVHNNSSLHNSIDNAFTWEDKSLFGREKVLEDLYGESNTAKAWESQEEDKEELMRNAEANLANITYLIKENPDIDFTVFYPPYSIAYWYKLNKEGSLSDKLDMYAYSVNELLKYNNVKVYFFMDDYEHIFDLDSYRDMCHFSPEENRYIFECMQDERFLVDEEAFAQRLHSFLEILQSLEDSDL